MPIWGEAAVGAGGAREGVGRLVVLLPRDDGEVDGRVHLWLRKDTVEQLHFEDVGVWRPLRLLLVGVPAEEDEALLEEDLEVAAPRRHLRQVADGLEQRRDAVARIEDDLQTGARERVVRLGGRWRSWRGCHST